MIALCEFVSGFDVLGWNFSAHVCFGFRYSDFEFEAAPRSLIVSSFDIRTSYFPTFVSIFVLRISGLRRNVLIVAPAQRLK